MTQGTAPMAATEIDPCEQFLAVRQQSVANCQPLVADDYGLQAEAFTSPPKWHLAHTTWFFETFILLPFRVDYRSPDPAYGVLFNSYYQGVGEQFPRPRRGLLSRPTIAEVMAYREHVDDAMTALLSQRDHPDRADILSRCELGMNHEQQHQELFFTDLKYSLHANPTFPTYLAKEQLSTQGDLGTAHWLDIPGGIVEIGHEGTGFSFDNEHPRHRVLLEPFQLCNRLVTNGEYQQFVDDGGYSRHEFWLADGWDTVKREGWDTPLYWVDKVEGRFEYTLHGLQPRLDDVPVSHLSGYEADAYACWAKARLPTEAEWEHAASLQAQPSSCNGREYHPEPVSGGAELTQLFGACWQWTRSAYEPYPGYTAAAGALGEYNGKFMSNQWVLRGSSCVTPRGHARVSYRNFFYPPDRWQFSGLRLAR